MLFKCILSKCQNEKTNHFVLLEDKKGLKMIYFFSDLSSFFGFISLIFFHAFLTRCPKVVIPSPLTHSSININPLIKPVLSGMISFTLFKVYCELNLQFISRPLHFLYLCLLRCETCSITWKQNTFSDIFNI